MLLALLLGDMAGMYREADDFRRAEELMHEALLEIGRKTIPLHPLMIDGLTMFADEMAKRGRTEEARRAFTWRRSTWASGGAASTRPTTGGKRH